LVGVVVKLAGVGAGVCCATAVIAAKISAMSAEHNTFMVVLPWDVFKTMAMAGTWQRMLLSPRVHVNKARAGMGSA